MTAAPVDRDALIREAIDRLETRARQAPAPGARLHSFRDVARVLIAELHDMADEAPQPEAQAENPARIDGLRPEFTDHASVESIDAQLRRARSQLRRWHLRVEWLISLRQARVEQKERDEWPATASQPGKEA